MIAVDPPKQVEVLRDGTWFPGWLDAWRRDDDGAWLGHVRYTMAVSEQFLDWVTEKHVRPIDIDKPQS